MHTCQLVCFLPYLVWFLDYFKNHNMDLHDLVMEKLWNFIVL